MINFSDYAWSQKPEPHQERFQSAELLAFKKAEYPGMEIHHLVTGRTAIASDVLTVALLPKLHQRDSPGSIHTLGDEQFQKLYNRNLWIQCVNEFESFMYHNNVFVSVGLIYKAHGEKITHEQVRECVESFEKILRNQNLASPQKIDHKRKTRKPLTKTVNTF